MNLGDTIYIFLYPWICRDINVDISLETKLDIDQKKTFKELKKTIDNKF